MKSYKVKAKIRFNDIVDNVLREVGDEFLCDEERYQFLLEHDAIEFIEENIIEEENQETYIEHKKKNKKADR